MPKRIAHTRTGEGDYRDGNRLRVLWVAPTLSREFGGPTTTVVNGMTAEAVSGIHNTVATTVAGGWMNGSGADPSRRATEQLQAAGIPVMALPRLRRLPRSEAWGLSPGLVVWMLRNLRSFDVIHLQYVWCLTTLWGCVLSRSLGVPAVLTPHESLTGYDMNVASGEGSRAGPNGCWPGSCSPRSTGSSSCRSWRRTARSPGAQNQS